MNSIPFSKTLYLYKDATFHGSIIIKDINSDPYLLSDGEKITFCIVQKGNTTNIPDVQITLTDEDEFEGEYAFVLMPEITSELDGDCYYYAYISFADGDKALIVPKTLIKVRLPFGVLSYYDNKNQITANVPRVMITDGNYYTDENGITHNQIPLGIPPKDAYAKTNLKLKSTALRLEKLINVTNENVGEVSDNIGSRITSEITNVNSRIDNIIAHNNDTEGNSELIDIRSGSDGNTYATAGNAVRVPYNNLKSAFESVTVSQNVYSDAVFDNTVTDKYMAVNHTEAEYNGAVYGAVTVHSGEKYKLKAKVGVNIRTYVIADANGNVTRYADAESFNTRHDYDVEITVSFAEDGGTLYVSSISDDYFGIKKSGSVYMLNGEKILGLHDDNPLSEKTAVFNGDSICHGTSVGSDNPTYGYGWAGRIGVKNNMTWKNYGVSGGTVTSDTYSWTSISAENVDFSSENTYYAKVGSSASGTDTMYVAVTENEWDGTSTLYLKGNARHWESTDIDTMYNEYPDADYVILESCLNDGFINVPQGTVSSGFSPSSTTTFASAMEYMIDRALTLFPNAKIGVIIPHRVQASSVNTYHDITRAVCAKWSIPYIDLYKESGICYNNTTQRAVMFDDDIHLTAAGYDMITSKIEAWMKTL